MIQWKSIFTKIVLYIGISIELIINVNDRVFNIKLIEVKVEVNFNIFAPCNYLFRCYVMYDSRAPLVSAFTFDKLISTVRSSLSYNAPPILNFLSGWKKRKGEYKRAGIYWSYNNFYLQICCDSSFFVITNFVGEYDFSWSN